MDFILVITCIWITESTIEGLSVGVFGSFSFWRLDLWGDFLGIAIGSKNVPLMYSLMFCENWIRWVGPFFVDFCRLLGFAWCFGEFWSAFKPI